MKVSKSFKLTSISILALSLSALATPAMAVFFHVGSGSIDGSLCVGNDCVNSESFGFDTIRLKENNLRIHFDDTSTAASFPRTDWRIVINDSANGGQNKFAVEDASAGREPFVIEGNAPANSLFVDSSGRVGIKKSNPVTELHLADGDTPTVRLEQDGSSGFNPQTWDMAGNETNFFVRDVTNGSTLPFRVRPGAPSSAIDIAANGDIGIGTASPQTDFHVNGGTGQSFVSLRLEAPSASPNTSADFTFTDGGADGAVRINIDDGDGHEMELDHNGAMTILGALTENSDVNNKTAIVPVDGNDILSKVSALPISAWTYKHDAEAGVRHIGPMAQDFYHLFGTGATEKGISTIDTAGVALAAIQALTAENAELQDETNDLKARLEALEHRMSGN